MSRPKLLPVVAEIAAEVRRRGLSMYAVAKAAGITPTVATRALNGERPDPQFSTVMKLADALGMRVKLVPAAD